MLDIESLAWEKMDGLLPAIAQDLCGVVTVLQNRHGH